MMANGTQTFNFSTWYTVQEHLITTCIHTGDPYVSQNDKPGFLSDDELKRLLVEVSTGYYVHMLHLGFINFIVL